MKAKVTITLAGTKETAKGSAPSPRISSVELDTKERMTITIGNALRFILNGLPLYKSYAPALTVQVDGEVIGYVTKFPSGSMTQLFTSVNMEVLRVIMTSRFTTEQLVDLSHSKDQIVNSIASVFGHKGNSINVAGAEQGLQAKQTSLSHILKYAKEGGKQIYQQQTPAEVIGWVNTQKENRRLISEAKTAATKLIN